MAAIFTPVQIGVGDWIATWWPSNQPVKLAAMEGLYETRPARRCRSAASTIDDELRYALEIPSGLSLLIHHDPDGVVLGLEEIPADERPPVNVVHLAYNVMVGLGRALLLLAFVFAWTWWRRRRIPGRPWFLRAVAVSGVAAIVAMEAGWTTTRSVASRGSSTASCGPRTR